MADVNLDVTFENISSLDANFGEVYAVNDGAIIKVIASLYSSEQTYDIGDYVIYSDYLYKCITTVVSPEPFNGEKWIQVKLADELEDKADLSDLPDMTQYYNINETDGLLDDKADIDSVYTKTQVDDKLAQISGVVGGQGISVVKVDNNNQISNTAGIYTVKSTNTKSNTQGEWTGNIEIPDLYNGLTIRYLVTRHTNITGVDNCMLNLTFSDGSESEFIDIMFDDNTFVKNEFQPDDIITLTYFDPAHSPTNDYVWLVQKPTVRQELTNENSALPLLLSETPSDILKTYNCGAKKTDNFTYNPSTRTLNVENVNAENIYTKNETYSKTEVDNALKVKSSVSVAQALSSGTEIGSVTVDGVATTFYAPQSGAQWTDITGTLPAGSTTITLSDVSITTNSTIDYYTDAFGVIPTSVVVTTGQVVLTFNVQASDLGVKVRVS